MLDSFGKNTKINPFFYILYVRMAFCSWRRYTGEFMRKNQEILQEDSIERLVKRENFQDFSLELSSDSEFSSSSQSSDSDDEKREGNMNGKKKIRIFADIDDMNREVEEIEEASSRSEFERIGERASEDERSENETSIRKPTLRRKGSSRIIDKHLLSPVVKRVANNKRDTWGYTKSDDQSEVKRFIRFG